MTEVLNLRKVLRAACLVCLFTQARTADVTPPAIESAGAMAGLLIDRVGVAFDEQLDPTSAETAGNYSVSGVSVTGARLVGNSGQWVLLNVSGTPADGFTVTADGVQDLAGNATDNATATGELSDMQTEDVGDPGVDPLLEGDAGYFGNGGYYVAGGGSDIWNNADAFRFVYQEFTGKFDMRVRVESLEGPDTWTKACLMAREFVGATDPGDRHVDVLATRTAGQNILNMQWRDTYAGGSGSKPAAERFGPVPYPNAWIRLVRETDDGNEFKCYLSTDGESWGDGTTPGIPYHVHTIPDDDGPLFETLHVGMAVTSHDNAADALGEAIFRSFEVQALRNAAPVIVEQPQDTAVQENLSATFSVAVRGDVFPTPTYQWTRNGEAIDGATDATYTFTAVPADDGAEFAVTVINSEGSDTSREAVLTVTDDVTPPELFGAEGSPNLTEIVLTFSEVLDPTSAGTTDNYGVASAGGSLNVTGASLSAAGTQVTLNTAAQSLGTKYTVTVNNVTDIATVPNPIAPNSTAVFLPVGGLVQDANGFIVIETENFDRNLDGLWTKDTTRGNPSGGASMVVANGAGGNEQNTKLEYDVEFIETGIHIVWYRASGNDGTDDSGWFHFDGERPIEREDGNQASMTGFSGQADFVWRSDPQDGDSPFTLDVFDAGQHVVAVARREDGSFFDKLIITTDEAYTPTGFGPPETREGAPGLPTITLTAPTDGQAFDAGADIPLAADASGQSDLEIVRVDFLADGTKVAEATSAPFTATWSGAAAGRYAVTATATDEIGQTTTSDAANVVVGTPPPLVILVIGDANAPNASDAGVQERLESRGYDVLLVSDENSQTSDADGAALIITSSTISSGEVGDKYQLVNAPVVNWEQALQDNYLMTGDVGDVDRGEATDQTEIEITDANHPLAGGLPVGVHTITSSPQTFTWGYPESGSGDPEIAALLADDTGNVGVYAYDAGALLVDGTTQAPARRVHIFLQNDGFAALNEDGLKLFDAALLWALGLDEWPPVEPDAPEITDIFVAAGNVTIAWDGDANLQRGRAVDGPYETIAGATSPYTEAVEAGATFYRLVIP